MKTIDFDIEKAKSGYYKIVTRGGNPARIICWNKQDGDFKIVALVTDSSGYEYAQSYTEKGDARESDVSFDLCLQVDEKDELTWEDLAEFEYAVAKVLYDEYFIKTNNQDILRYIKRVANELYEAAENQFIHEQAFKDANRDFNEVFHDVIETALWKHWRESKLSGVSGIRYTTQGSVIYDCVGGKEIDRNTVLDVVEGALNYKNLSAQPTFDGICIDTTKPNNKRYVEEHTFKSIDEQDEQVLRRHITKDSISYLGVKVLKENGWSVSEHTIKVSESMEEGIIKKYISENVILGEVLKVLKDCGWCVIKQDEVTDIYDLAESITERMQRISNVKKL